MGIAFSEATLALLDGKNYAVLATVNPDGSPQTSVVWVGRDGGDLLFSTVAGRVKHRNMSRDPRVSVTVIDSSDAENYVELRGRVSITPDVGRRVDTELSWKYDGKDPDPDRAGAVRVIVRMVVEKATGYAALTDLTCHHLAQHLIWRDEDLLRGQPHHVPQFRKCAPPARVIGQLPHGGECTGGRLYLPRRPSLRISKGALCGQRTETGVSDG